MRRGRIVLACSLWSRRIKGGFDPPESFLLPATPAERKVAAAVASFRSAGWSQPDDNALHQVISSAGIWFGERDYYGDDCAHELAEIAIDHVLLDYLSWEQIKDNAVFRCAEALMEFAEKIYFPKHQ